MKYQINNFTDADQIDVESVDYTDTQGIGDKLVLITQRGGSMRFQHGMTVTQARALAEALLACCEELE